MKTGPKPIPAEIRFLKHIQRGKDCWLWAGARAGGRHIQQRYGVFSDGTQVFMYAHRWAYTHFKGPIPPGMQVNHTCDNSLCVNPEHLVLGTQHDNVLDMHHRGRACGRQRRPPGRRRRSPVPTESLR